MATSVSGRCISCLTTLRSIAVIVSTSDWSHVSVDQINEDLDRLNLWIGDTGAHHRPGSTLSLESRLCDTEWLLSYIYEVLENLEEASEELLQFVTRKRVSESASITDIRDDELDGPVDDFCDDEEYQKEINSCMACLFRISRQVHHIGPQNIFAEALSRIHLIFDNERAIDYVSEKFPKLAFKRHTWLRERLGRAITQRRRHLKSIREEHWRSLDSTGSDCDSLDAFQKLEEQIRKSLDDEISTTSDVNRTNSPSSLATASECSANSAETATTGLETDSTRFIPANDMNLDELYLSKVPQLPDIRSRSDEYFTCLYCMDSIKVEEEDEWKDHVFCDLRPYICTFPDCDTAHRRYGDIDEWWKHEVQNHRAMYSCPLCKDRSDEDRNTYLAHLHDEHAKELKYSDEQIFLAAGLRPLAKLTRWDCPCCFYLIEQMDSDRDVRAASNVAVHPHYFKNHLASHLKYLALSSLPVDGTDVYD